MKAQNGKKYQKHKKKQQQGMWTGETITQLKEWQHLLEDQAKLHQKYALSLKCYEGLLTYSMLTIGVVSSTLQLFSTVKSGESLISVGCTVLTSTATLLGVIQRQLNLQVVRDRHWQASRHFEELALEINAQIMLPEESRIPLAEFIKDMASRRATLMQSEPQLPSSKC